MSGSKDLETINHIELHRKFGGGCRHCPDRQSWGAGFVFGRSVSRVRELVRPLFFNKGVDAQKTGCAFTRHHCI